MSSKHNLHKDNGFFGLRPSVGPQKDEDTINMIVDRAENMYQELNNIGINAATIMMDITAAHCNGCPLDLVGLFAADNRDFFHDIHGIMKHIDRRTGKLTDCFIPRHSVSTRKNKKGK